MGNKNSTASASSSTANESERQLLFKNRINRIAANFILGRKFNDLKLLVSEKYCNDLMILTKDVLAENFTTDEIKYLATGSSTANEPLMYISKRDFANIENNTRNRKLSMCKGIAKFYVRVAHLFAAIATTVSPNWSGLASNPSSQFDATAPLRGPPMPAVAPQPLAPIRGGQQLQDNVNATASSGNNSSGAGNTDFCSVRIRALLGATKIQNNTVFVQPTVCSVYASNENPLLKQPGIPDLEYLYNDVYNYDTGKFTGRSIAMQALYSANVKMLYTEFTGETDVPANIKTFGDINMSSLARYTECGNAVQTPKPAPVKRDDRDRDRDRYRDQGWGWNPRHYENDQNGQFEAEKALINQDSTNSEEYYKMKSKNYSGTFKSQFSVAKNSAAYSNYGAHIKQMMVNADRARENLMQVIDKLFLIVESPASNPESSGNKTPIITVHPKLTYEILDGLINQTRELIIKLYVGCERDFYTGMSLLHVIIEEIMNANLTAQLKSLKMDTRKKIETAHQTAMRANTRNGVIGSSGLAYVPELLSPDDTKAIQTYEDAQEDDNATTTAKLNAQQNAQPQQNVNLTNGDDAVAPGPPAPPAPPAPGPAPGPASGPAAPRVDIKLFNSDEDIILRPASKKNSDKSSLRLVNSPKKNFSVKFGGGRRRN